MADKRAPYKARAFVSATGKWYVTPDKNGRFTVPKAFSLVDPKKGYRFELVDERTIFLVPNKNYSVLTQLCIPSEIRNVLNVSGGEDIFRIENRENGKGFKLTLCREKGDVI